MIYLLLALDTLTLQVKYDTYNYKVWYIDSSIVDDDTILILPTILIGDYQYFSIWTFGSIDSITIQHLLLPISEDYNKVYFQDNWETLYTCNTLLTYYNTYMSFNYAPYVRFRLLFPSSHDRFIWIRVIKGRQT